MTIGRPNSSISGDGPLSSTSTTSDNSNRPMYGLSEVFKVVAAPPTEVPSDWSLIPAALTTGDTFRLIFLSSTKRNGSDDDIADYNTFVQDLAAAGHADIQAYSDGFRVVGCTAAVDAVGNTDTTGVGVPIYWLNGNKVADDYADFYDEDWDEEAVNKNELGANGRNTNNSGNYPITGCDHDGTEAFALATPPSVALGSSTSVRVGRPNSSDTDNGPISSSSNVGNGTDRPMYGLSEVFKVVAAANATGKPAIMGTAEVGQTLTASKGTIVDTNGTTKADNGDSGYAYTYQWVRVSGGTETTISGATGTTYTPVADDVGNTIKVQASFTDDADNAEGPLTSDATAAVVEACDALWCATMTVGSSGGATGFSDGTGEFNAMGSLSPSQFRFEGAAITMNSLVYAGSSTNVDLSLEFTHSILGSSDYTLELNDESFILSVTGGSGFFDVEGLPARPNFANSDTVTVKLYEGVRGGSDDATLTSLEFWEASGEDTELVTLTPAFDAGTTEYTAAVDYRFLHASIQNIVRGHNGALVVVTDEFGSHDLGSVEDSAEGLELAVGENTITVEVTAEDRNTTVTYTLVVTRTAPPPPPAHCETGDIWCATLTVASLPDSQIGYSGTLGALSHVAFEHDGPFYLVEALYFITVSGVGNSLRIEFHPSGGTVFNTDAYSLFIDGTEFAFSDATFSSGHFEWADTGLLWAPADTVEVRLFERTAPAVRVPTDWSLIPAGLTTGDQFRLIFLSSTRRNGTATDIATYNTFVQTRAAAGHTDIQAYSTWFSVVGCTADTDAIVNTGTTGGGGVPIYWLNGAKVADDYADFYDGDWDEEAVNKNELGENGLDITNSDNYPLTGCDHDGTESLRSNLSFGLGTSDGLLTVGRPNSSGTDRGPLFSDSDVLGTDNHPMYGLSAVFGVGVEGANSDPTFPMSTAVREVAENTEAGQVVGTVLTATDFDMDTLTYSLEGTNLLSFDLDTTTTPGSAQIRTKTGVTYDHEVKSSYSVIIKADDGHGGTPASVTVTITITDVSEPPGRPAAPTVMATAGSTTSLDVSWNAPTNTGPNIDNYDLQYREGTSGGFTDGPQDVTGTSAAIPSLDAGTSYQVQVRATNAEGDSDWSLSGSGTTTAEACDGIWCATLMPQAISGSGGGLGCANSSTGDRCTNTAHLTEDEFRHDMTDYQVTAVQVRNNNGQLQLWISPDLTTATQSLVLHVGSESFAFEDADTKQAGNRRWNSSGLSWSVSDTIELKLTEGAGPPTEVPADWSLIPAALSSGDTFRLIFLSSTKRNGSATDIATYNTFVQDRAAAGHADIQAYSDGFRVVGCTATVDARDNTGTTYTSSNKGVPIYWLSGNKVVDEYEDFYDGNWDDEANDKNELGNNGPDTTDNGNYPLTGCDHDGTEAFSVSMASRSLGSTAGIVYVGRPNSSDTDNGPISNSSTGATLTDRPPHVRALGGLQGGRRGQQRPDVPDVDGGPQRAREHGRGSERRRRADRQRQRRRHADLHARRDRRGLLRARHDHDRRLGPDPDQVGRDLRPRGQVQLHRRRQGRRRWRRHRRQRHGDDHDHGRERGPGAAGGADGDGDRGIDHQPVRELDRASDHRSRHRRLRPALPRGHERELEQRPAERDRHACQHRQPRRRNLVPGAGTRHQRRGQQQLVALGQRLNHCGGDADGEHLGGQDQRGLQGRRDHLHADAQRLDDRRHGRLGHADADEGLPGNNGAQQDGDDLRGADDGDLHGGGHELPALRGGRPGRGRNPDRDGAGRHRLRPGDSVLGRCGHRHRRDGPAGSGTLGVGADRELHVQGDRAHGCGRALPQCRDGHHQCVLGRYQRHQKHRL